MQYYDDLKEGQKFVSETGYINITKEKIEAGLEKIGPQ